jgi:hypothetical protein
MLYDVVPSFRLIACRDCGGYVHGVIHVRDGEYAYYDDGCDRIFFLGGDWDTAVDRVWDLEERQEPEGMKFYTFVELYHRGLEDILMEIRFDRDQKARNQDS